MSRERFIITLGVLLLSELVEEVLNTARLARVELWPVLVRILRRGRLVSGSADEDGIVGGVHDSSEALEVNGS